MSHHSSEPNKELSEAMRGIFGEFPAGKLNQDDAGAIAMSVGVENNRVVLRFPKPVAWVGMTGDEAFELAQLFLKHARNAGVTAPIIITIGGGREAEIERINASLNQQRAEADKHRKA